MADHDQYFEYLTRRSLLGVAYRLGYLFPRVARRLPGRAVDVGCGVGDMLRVRPGTIGLDINPRLVAHCQEQGFDARLMQPDVLPLDSESMDSVLLDNVLEHIAQPQPLLREVHRVLKVKGVFVVGVPGKRGWDSDPDHKVFYDRHTLRQCVSEAGFSHVSTFFAPWVESEWMSRHLRQYFVYGVFARDPA